MAYIETLKESMIKETTSNEDVYPATSSQAVFRQTAEGSAPSGVKQKLEDSLLDIEQGISTLDSTKQNNIADLETIRSGAAAGATAYQLPGSGIPKTDMSSGVQSSLGKADSAYQLPGTGVPKSDLSDGVQNSLNKADAAAPQFTTYTKTEIDTLLTVPTSGEIENVLGEVIV